MSDPFKGDTFDLLRIIARDGGRLDMADRATIANAADELETALNYNVKLHQAALETNAEKIAIAEQLRELRAKLPAPLEPAWSYSSGPMMVIQS